MDATEPAKIRIHDFIGKMRICRPSKFQNLLVPDVIATAIQLTVVTFVCIFNNEKVSHSTLCPF